MVARRTLASLLALSLALAVAGVAADDAHHSVGIVSTASTDAPTQPLSAPGASPPPTNATASNAYLVRG
jgi:hypothetical protein